MTRIVEKACITGAGKRSFNREVQFLFYIGFKAHTVHKKCLESYNETLSFAFNESGRELPIPENGILSWINFDGETVTATLPRCNLEEELDNVRSLSELLAFFNSLRRYLKFYFLYCFKRCRWRGGVDIKNT